jgi:hypothetical protein
MRLNKMPYCEDCKKFKKKKNPKKNDWDGRCTFFEVGTNCLSDSCNRLEEKGWNIDPELYNRGLMPIRRNIRGLNDSSEIFE